MIRPSPRKKNMKLSIIIPIYNEQDSIPALYGSIIASLEKATNEFEIIMINDG